MKAAPDPVIRITRRFDFPPERVFDAWVDPALAARWLFATPTGRIVRCEIDARVGGKFVIVDRRDGEDVEHVGEYRAFERPTRLVFTFAVPKYSAQVTQVTIEIAPCANGCELTLHHERVLPEWASQTEEGWKKLLESLDSKLK